MSKSAAIHRAALGRPAAPMRGGHRRARARRPAAAASADADRRALLSFAQAASAEDVDHFARAAPRDVVAALQATVEGLVGTLPHQAFKVKVRERRGVVAAGGGGRRWPAPTAPRRPLQVEAADADVGQLLFSCVLTGYATANVESRLSLRARLAPEPTAPPPRGVPAAAAVAAAAAAGAYEPGVNADRVTGDVHKWHREEGLVAVPAGSYVEALEAELAAARLALAATSSSPAPGARPNAVLGFLRTADPDTLAGLTAGASPAALEAGNAFVQRVLGSRRSGSAAMAGPELAAMLLFSAVFGYMLRTIEARRDLEASLLLPP